MDSQIVVFFVKFPSTGMFFRLQLPIDICQIFEGISSETSPPFFSHGSSSLRHQAQVLVLVHGSMFGPLNANISPSSPSPLSLFVSIVYYWIDSLSIAFHGFYIAFYFSWKLCGPSLLCEGTLKSELNGESLHYFCCSISLSLRSPRNVFVHLHLIICFIYV